MCVLFIVTLLLLVLLAHLALFLLVIFAGDGRRDLSNDRFSDLPQFVVVADVSGELFEVILVKAGGSLSEGVLVHLVAGEAGCFDSGEKQCGSNSGHVSVILLL